MNYLEEQTELIPIWDQNENVYLKAYSFDESAQEKPAVIICPGGGYLCISESESDPVAHRFAEAGYQPFVLSYSVMEQARYQEEEPFKPVLELTAAFALVHRNAGRWNVDRNKIIVIGFSAGGHLAARYCACKNRNYFKPAALLLSYPLIDYKYLNRDWKSDMDGDQIDLYQLATRKVFGTIHPSEEQLKALDVKNHISDQMPPVFIWHAMDDNVIDVESSIRLVQKLRSLSVPGELHLFEKGIHGEPFYDSTWFELALTWLKGIINEK